MGNSLVARAPFVNDLLALAVNLEVDAGTARFAGYINNLDEDKYPALYRDLEKLFGTALPLFESMYGFARTLDPWDNREDDDCEADLPEPGWQSKPPIPVKPVSHLEGGEIRFKRGYSRTGAGQVFWNINQVRSWPVNEMVDESVIPLGSLATPQGRLFVFPNSHIHTLSDMVSADGSLAERSAD